MKALALSLLLSSVLIAHPTQEARGADPGAKEHPGVVALSQDAVGVWQYKSFPQLTQLYVSQRDRRDTSNCDERCASAWPPLVATDHSAGQKVGLWSVIQRSDGKQQWAYKGQPLYTYAKDTAGQPATGVSPAWPRAKG